MKNNEINSPDRKMLIATDGTQQECGQYSLAAI